MDKRLLALLIAAAAIALHGCSREPGPPVGNLSAAAQGGADWVPDWRR